MSGMAHNQPAKCQRVRVGRADHDPIPFTNEFSAVHACEARVICIGRELLSVPTKQLIQCEDDEMWHSALSWLPINDPQYALDPDGEWYDEVLEGRVMDNFDNHSEATAAKGKHLYMLLLSINTRVLPKSLHKCIWDKPHQPKKPKKTMLPWVPGLTWITNRVLYASG